jgi:phosphatidylserine decarboxylase
MHQAVRFFVGAEGQSAFVAVGTVGLGELLAQPAMAVQLVDASKAKLTTDAHVSSFLMMTPNLSPPPDLSTPERLTSGTPQAAEASPSAVAATAGPGKAAPIQVQQQSLACIRIGVEMKDKRAAQEWFVRGLLEQFDTDGDGKFSLPELACMMSVLKAGSDRDAIDASTYEAEASALMNQLDSSNDQLLDTEELLAFLMSHDFQHSPFGYSIVNFLADGVEGRLALMDLYPIAQQAGETSGGADIVSVHQGMGAPAHDTDGLLVWDDTTGLVVREHIPRFVKMALDMAYKGVLSSGALARTGAMRAILRKLTAHEGAHMASASSKSMIQPFIIAHGINVDEIADPVHSFGCFNDFFVRKLAPGARQVAEPSDAGVAVSPADCRLLVFASTHDATSIWIKGASFTIEGLLGPAMAHVADRFVGGALVIARLAPQDYHRWHFPVSGVYGTPAPISGELFTVNPIAVRRDIDVYTRNQRSVSLVETEAFGTVAMVAVGATMVGSINLTATPETSVSKGDEHGFFAFGGSTVVLLFQPGRIRFEAGLLKRSQMPLETLVRMGRRIGVAANTPLRAAGVAAEEAGARLAQAALSGAAE